MFASSRGRRLAVPLLAFLIGALALGAAAFLTLTPGGRQVTAADVGGPFALVNQDGRPVTEADFRGAPHLVFFGFTHCPDVCPTTLFQISEILRAVGNKGRTLRALFITVDPERDTPPVLKAYLGSFDERIVGLTGDRAAVEQAVRAYRGLARKVPLKDGDYTMEHTTVVYLMDKDGRFVGTFDANRPVDQAAADLRRLL